MSAHPADMERAEQLREQVVAAQDDVQALVSKILQNHKDLDLARERHKKAVREYLDFKPVVEGQP